MMWTPLKTLTVALGVQHSASQVSWLILDVTLSSGRRACNANIYTYGTARVSSLNVVSKENDARKETETNKARGLEERRKCYEQFISWWKQKRCVQVGGFGHDMDVVEIKVCNV